MFTISETYTPEFEFEKNNKISLDKLIFYIIFADDKNTIDDRRVGDKDNHYWE